MPSRRQFLEWAAVATVVGVAGCTADTANESTGSQRDTTTTAVSTTTTTTTATRRSDGRSESPTEFPTEPPTNTCDEQYVAEDIRISNRRPSTVTVSVEIEATPSVPDPPFFAEKYRVEDETVVEEPIFENANTDRYDYELLATVDDQTARVDVTTMAQTPRLYTRRIEIAEEIGAYQVVSAPGERHNPNCYGED